MSIINTTLLYAAITDTLRPGMLEEMLAGLELFFMGEPGLRALYGQHAGLFDPNAVPPGLQELIDHVKDIRDGLPRTQTIARALYLSMYTRFQAIRDNVSETHPTHPMIASRPGGAAFVENFGAIVTTDFVMGRRGMTSADLVAAAVRTYAIAENDAGLDTLHDAPLYVR